jgi:hypothetical protein
VLIRISPGEAARTPGKPSRQLKAGEAGYSQSWLRPHFQPVAGLNVNVGYAEEQKRQNKKQ